MNVVGLTNVSGIFFSSSAGPVAIHFMVISVVFRIFDE